MTGIMKKGSPMALVASLKARAARGDRVAIAELQKLKAIGAQYKAAAMEAAASSAAEEVVEGDEDDEDIVGGDSPDKLESADFIARKYDGADGLVQKVKLREHGWKGLNDVAKFARINPPSVMQGSLGGYQIVRSDNVKPIQVAMWGGDDEETLPITVTFMPVEQIQVAGVTPLQSQARPFGVVKFGTRAMVAEAQVDIGKGCQFTVSGAFCTLEVGVDLPDVAVVTSMKLGGMLSFYPVVRTTPVTRTVYVSVAATDFQTFPIPAFAKNVTLVAVENIAGPPPSIGAYQIQVQDSTGTEIYSKFFAAGAAVISSIPLSDDAATIAIKTGFAGSQGVSGRLIFELSF
jgi:hypothetical protein